MRYLKFLFVVLLCLSVSGISNAQKTIDPIKWTFEMKKLEGNLYEVIFHANMDSGWHIFSLNPGDKSLIAPSFHFETNPNVSFDGKIEERGKLTTATFEGIDNPVNYYEGNVDFVIKVHLLNRAPLKIITGDHEYQVCNDRMCLPPVWKPFVFDVPNEGG